MKIAEIKNKNNDELTSDIALLKKELFNLRFQQMTRKLENTGRFKQVKRSLARIKTILRQREISSKIGGQNA